MKPVPRRLVLVALGVVVAVVGVAGLSFLGGRSTDERSFCNQAFEFTQFKDRFGDVASNPGELESFMENWDQRLENLSNAAPDEALAELSLMRAGVQQLDAQLAEVEYDLFELGVDDLSKPDADEASARFDLLLADDCRINVDGAEVLVPAPDPLDDDEFDELVDVEADEDTIDSQLQEELLTQLGLSDQEEQCFVASLSSDDLTEILSGQVSESARKNLVSALDECGIEIDG